MNKLWEDWKREDREMRENRWTDPFWLILFAPIWIPVGLYTLFESFIKRIREGK